MAYSRTFLSEIRSEVFSDELKRSGAVDVSIRSWNDLNGQTFYTVVWNWK